MHPIFRSQKAGEVDVFHREAEIHPLDTGHFALETQASEIGTLMYAFLQRRGL